MEDIVVDEIAVGGGDIDNGAVEDLAVVAGAMAWQPVAVIETDSGGTEGHL